MGGQIFCGLAVDEGEDWLMNFFGPCMCKQMYITEHHYTHVIPYISKFSLG